MIKDIEKSYNPLETEKISRLLYKFSVPAIIGMTVNALYNIVDRMFIGNSPDLGANGLAAITICFPAMIVMMSIGILLGQGGATMFSINLGKGDKKKADKILGNTMTLMLILSFTILIIGELFLDRLLVLFGASTSILPLSRDYMRIIFIGSPFLILSMGTNHFLRASGRPKLAMITMFLGAGINIILDPIFIFLLRMGMTGAALATIISQLFSMSWGLYNFIRKDSEHLIKFKNMKLESNITKNIFTLGMPGFLLQLANSVLLLTLNSSLLKYGGDIAVSAMGIVNSVQTLLILPIIGVNQGLQPIVSFNYGAKKIDRVKEAVKLGIITATIISIFGFILSHAIPDLLVAMFNRDEKLLEFGTYAMKIWFLCIPLAGFQIVASNFFQAIGKAKKAMFLTLTRQIIFLIPAIIIFSGIWKLNGILFAAPFADFSSALITLIFFLKFIKGFDEVSYTV